METVEVVIKLPKNIFGRFKNMPLTASVRDAILEAVENGTVLPKHDRLIDTHDLDLCIIARMININATNSIPLKDLDDCIKNETKTILEANTEKRIMNEC